jgi:hypothetical protein
MLLKRNNLRFAVILVLVLGLILVEGLERVGHPFDYQIVLTAEQASQLYDYISPEFERELGHLRGNEYARVLLTLQRGIKEFTLSESNFDHQDELHLVIHLRSAWIQGTVRWSLETSDGRVVSTEERRISARPLDRAEQFLKAWPAGL